MRKKVDERIRTVIENGVKTRHRSMFVIVGDKSRDQALFRSFLICLQAKFHMYLDIFVAWEYEFK